MEKVLTYSARIVELEATIERLKAEAAEAKVAEEARLLEAYKEANAFRERALGFDIQVEYWCGKLHLPTLAAWRAEHTIVPMSDAAMKVLVPANAF